MKQILPRSRRLIYATAFAALALSCVVHAADRPSAKRVLGRWLTESGNLEIDIAPCGEALCGTVVRVLSDRSMQDPNGDMKPADARPALGMAILSDFTPDGENQWRGKIYNRENAKTYKCVIVPLSATQLSVHGYVWVPLFGKTQVWHRITEAEGADR